MVKTLNQLSQENKFPFMVTRAMAPAIASSQRTVAAGETLVIVGKMSENLFKAVQAKTADGSLINVFKRSPIALVDTKSYSHSPSGLDQCSDEDKKKEVNRNILRMAYRMMYGKKLPLDQDLTLAPIEVRQEYVATCAYYMSLKGEGEGDLDRWLKAEKWIDERFLFVPRMKIPTYR
jgi:hypothetical protein